MADLVQVLINAVDRTAKVRFLDTEIIDQQNEVPNTASLVVRNVSVSVGHEVKILHNSVVLFDGLVTDVDVLQKNSAQRPDRRLTCVDWTWLLDRRLANKHYTSTAADAIVTDLISTYTSGFTTTNVQASLATVTDFPTKMETLSQALTRLANLVGAFWYVDYGKDLHFRTTENLTNPTALTSTNATFRELLYRQSDVQIRTRVFVEGYGSTALAAAAVGDTVLQVVDPSFYNVAGGTVIAGSQRITYTAVGSGNILTPLWVTVTKPLITTPKWSSAAYSSTWHRFVIVGNAKVATSPDGLTWTEQTASWTGQAGCVVWAAALSLFVVVTWAGEVATSPTGITWTSRTAAAANAWQGLVWAPELSGGLLVAVAGSGTNRVMTSPDGTTWTSRSAASALNWWGVSWSPSLALLVAVANQSGATSAMSSTDGTTWTSRTPSNTAKAWSSVTWSPTVAKFVAVGTVGAVMYSSNGTSWTSITDLSGAATALTSVLWVPEESRYIAILYNTTRIITSTNATTWSEEALQTTGLWGLNGPNGLAYGDGTVIGVADDSGNAVLCANISDHFSELTGIPASSTGSITEAIAQGDEINILVQRDDAAAQTALVAVEGGDGIHEHYIQDRRLSITGANARGDAELTLGKDPDESATFLSTDVNVFSGRSIAINISGINTTLKIQQVRFFWDSARPTAPVRQVTATNRFKSFYEYVREMQNRTEKVA